MTTSTENGPGTIMTPTAEKKHTAGPWFVTGDPGHEAQSASWLNGITIGSVPDGTRICDLTRLRVDWQNEANARLIVAAPDLLAALGELADAVDDGLCNSGVPGFDAGRLDRALTASRAALSKVTSS